MSFQDEQFNPNLCRIDDGLETITGKWKIPILLHIMKHQTLRSSDLMRAIPHMTQKMLTKNLRELEMDDIISRTTYPVIPPRVEYSLTAHGKKLEPILNQLHQWGIQHRYHIQQKWQNETNNDN